MLRIDRNSKKFTRLTQKRLSEVGLLERGDIQQMILASPESFFSEMGEELLLIGEEVRPAEFVADRIDLLAIDNSGAVVVIELKRGKHKLHLLQSLTYAAMISTWDTSRLADERSRLTPQSAEEAADEIEQFLLDEASGLNRSQRIILIAGDFDYEVLVTAEWLTEQYEVDIRCYRLVHSADGHNEYLACTCIYPPPEITKHAVRRRRQKGAQKAKWSDWDKALEAVDNEAIVSFFRAELKAGRENYLPKRSLLYRLDGKRRWQIAARRNTAYVWQDGRFPDDQGFWQAKLGREADVQPVKDDQCLRFYLVSSDDFAKFSEAMAKEVSKIEFLESDGDAEEQEEL